jgi:hypothetical protein
MEDHVRKFADGIVKAVRLVCAAGYLAWACVLAYVAVWIAGTDGNRLMIVIGVIVGCYAGKYLMKAGEAYLSARPQEPPDVRQRRLESRLLYRPRSRDPDRAGGTQA